MACNRLQPTTAPPSLAVIGNLEGTTEPCGCTSRPLGGVDRLAQTLMAWRQAGPTALAVVGDTFVTESAPAEQMRRHEQDKAKALAEIVAKLQPAAVALGPKDHGSQWQTLQGLPAATRRALQLDGAQGEGTPSSRDAAATPWPAIKVPLGRGSAWLLRAAAPPPADAAARVTYVAALTAQARRLRQPTAGQAPGPIVALWPYSVAAARQALEGLGEVDIILTGGTSVLTGDANAALTPEPVGSATLLQAGARGERLGRLRLHNAERPGPWQFFDGSRSQRLALTARAEQLAAAAAALPEGPGRDARVARAAALHAAAAALPNAPPGGAYYTWDLEDIDTSHPPAPWASQALARFNASLCDSARADTAKRTCPPAATPADAYVGTQACQGCHSQAFAVYAKTAHARAWATLTDAGKQCDLSCVGCHVVGFEQPGGFCHLADAPTWANVGCESCHGPGAGHAAAPGDRQAWSRQFVRDTPQSTCVNCHNREHSDQFNFATYRPKILGPGHGLPAAP